MEGSFRAGFCLQCPHKLLSSAPVGGAQSGHGDAQRHPTHYRTMARIVPQRPTVLEMSGTDNSTPATPHTHMNRHEPR